MNPDLETAISGEDEVPLTSTTVVVADSTDQYLGLVWYRLVSHPELTNQRASQT